MTILLFLGGLGGWEIMLSYFIMLLLPLIALISCLKSDMKNSTNKLIWVIVIIVVPIVGPILYFIIGRDQKN